MQFQVPQFIEVEDKIFGPLTFKQFLYVLGGAGGAFVAFKLLPSFLGIPVALLIGGLAALLAFYKINNRPFVLFLESAVKYLFQSKLYVWKREYKKPTQAKQPEKAPAALLNVSRVSQNKLRDLSWNIEVGGKKE